jgi:hypothetical protein
MSPLTFLELEGALLLAGLLCELLIATFVLKGVRRRPAELEPPADWEPPSAALVTEPARSNNPPRPCREYDPPGLWCASCSAGFPGLCRDPR